MKISNTPFILVTALCLATPALAQISDTTRQSASAFVGRSAPRAAAAAPATNDGLMVVDKPFDGPRAEPKLPLAPARKEYPPEPPVPPPAVAAPASKPTWEIKATDVRLDRVMERWAQTAGWRVQWDANRHVELAGPNTFSGSFQEVVSQVLSTPGIRLSDYPLEGCIYPNTPPLVRITRMGDQVNECPEEYKQ